MYLFTHLIYLFHIFDIFIYLYILYISYILYIWYIFHIFIFCILYIWYIYICYFPLYYFPKGFLEGFLEGFAEGFAEGFVEGFAEGFALCSAERVPHAVISEWSAQAALRKGRKASGEPFCERLCEGCRPSTMVNSTTVRVYIIYIEIQKYKKYNI